MLRKYNIPIDGMASEKDVEVAEKIVDKLHEMVKATNTALSFDCDVEGVQLELAWDDEDKMDSIIVRVVEI